MDWAVNLEQETFCTQLISDTFELREGVNWYLLLVKERAFVFIVDAFRSEVIDGHIYREATLETPVNSEDLSIVQELACDAHEAVSYRHERITFLKPS